MDIAALQVALGTAYRIQRELGRGGMATVYLADDTKHGRQVALKVLHPEFAASLGPDRFRREITTAGLELYLERPAGVTVVEWIERWLAEEPWPAGRGVRFRRVEIKSAGETDREILYEDFGG